MAGTPTAAGPYSFYLTVTDAGGQTLSVLMSGGVGSLGVTPDNPPPARVGVPYSQTLVPSGWIAPYTFQTTSTSFHNELFPE